jgi:hypothetical protein
MISAAAVTNVSSLGSTTPPDYFVTSDSVNPWLMHLQSK